MSVNKTDEILAIAAELPMEQLLALQAVANSICHKQPDRSAQE